MLNRLKWGVSRLVFSGSAKCLLLLLIFFAMLSSRGFVVG
jgi:hypothetical protein